MTPLETLLVSAIVGLCGAIALLWRYIVGLHATARAEATGSARLIFALLQRLALVRGERPPPTMSTPTNPINIEAKALALKELNGEIDRLLAEYLESERPTKG